MFNSHIILHQESDSQQAGPVVRYLPLFEESEFTLSEMERLKEIMNGELGSEDKKLSWRLGLLLLNGYLGSPILSQ